MRVAINIYLATAGTRTTLAPRQERTRWTWKVLPGFLASGSSEADSREALRSRVPRSPWIRAAARVSAMVDYLVPPITYRFRNQAPSIAASVIGKSILASKHQPI